LGAEVCGYLPIGPFGGATFAVGSTFVMSHHLPFRNCFWSKLRA
jgi:hypothetical protein